MSPIFRNILRLFWLIIIALFIAWMIKSPAKEEPVIFNHIIADGSLGGCYKKVGDTVYCFYDKDILPNPDLNSFRVMDYNVAIDKDHVYFRNKIGKGIDPKTFFIYNKGVQVSLFGDKNGVYTVNKDGDSEAFTLDINSLQQVGSFLKDKDGVYHLNNGKPPFTRVRGFDIATFSKYNGPFLRMDLYQDKNGIYLRDEKGDFKPFTIDTLKARVLDNYIIDKNAVYINKYYFLKKVEGIDPLTFDRYKKEGMDFNLFSDKNGIYIGNEDGELKPFTLKNIERLGAGYARDSESVYISDYYKVSKLEGADPETFHILGVCMSVETSSASYAADKNHVYVGGTLLEGINPNKFIRIGSIDSESDSMPYSIPLWKDDKAVYIYCGDKIKEADYETFEYKDGKAQDKNNYYKFNTGGGNYTVTPKNS